MKMFDTKAALAFALGALIEAQLRQCDYLTLANKAKLEKAKDLMDAIWDEDGEL